MNFGRNLAWSYFFFDFSPQNVISGNLDASRRPIYTHNEALYTEAHGTQPKLRKNTGMSVRKNISPKLWTCNIPPKK